MRRVLVVSDLDLFLKYKDGFGWVVANGQVLVDVGAASKCLRGRGHLIRCLPLCW